MEKKYKQPQKIIDLFMTENGYTKTYSKFFGIRKDYKNRDDWDYKDTDEVLIHFLKWYKKYEELE